MTKNRRGRGGPTPPRNPLADLMGMAAAASMGQQPEQPVDDAAGTPNTRLALACAFLHERCSKPFPSTHRPDAPRHVKDAQAFLAKLDAADDAPTPAEAPADPLATAAERLEEVEEVVRSGDFAALAVKLRERSSAYTRAVASAVLGLR